MTADDQTHIFQFYPTNNYLQCLHVEPFNPNASLPLCTVPASAGPPAATQSIVVILSPATAAAP